MNRRTLTLSTALLCLGVALPGAAVAQTAKDIVGSWTLVSSETVNSDGSKVATFGANPKGNLIYTNDGRFMYLLSRADLPKFASNNRASGTSDENKAVVQGSISLFGTYSVAGNDLLIKIEHSTFPNWSGTDQKRTITLTGDEMKWTNPAGSAGGVVTLAFKRAPARTTN
jgi:hypothetical protein